MIHAFAEVYHLQKFMTSKDDSVITILFTWPKVQVKFLNQSALKDFRKLEIEDQADGTRGFHFHDLAKIESVLFKSSWNCWCCNFNQLRVQNGWSRFRSGHQVAPGDHQLIDRFELNHQSWPFLADVVEHLVTFTFMKLKLMT